MLDGRSCVVPRLFSGSCQAENKWSFMNYMPDLDIKNGKRPSDMDGEDESQPRKVKRRLDSCHQGETARILLQQQSCHAEDSVVPQMDQDDQRKDYEALSNCQRVEKAGAFSVQQQSAEQAQHQSNKQQKDQSGDSSDSDVDEKKQLAGNLLNSNEEKEHHVGGSSDSGVAQSDEQQEQHGG